MKLIRTIVIITCLYIAGYSQCFATENLFYILRSNAPDRISSVQSSQNSLSQHFQSITILVSQAYQIDENGVVWGFIDGDVLDFAQKHDVKVMPLITNVAFDKQKAHQFLSNNAAQAKAIQSILDACNKFHYYGVQLDFEMIALEDRDALTKFYEKTTKALHHDGYKVSYAIAPVVSDKLQPSDFLKKIYVNWEGAYDLKRLGAMGDFVSLMAYNQHGQGTTPGPTASLQWVKTTIEYTLQYIPAQKISLGVPVYSNYWYTGTDNGTSAGKIVPLAVGINYAKALYLLRKYNANLAWDNTDQLYYAAYDHNWLKEYLFIEDEKSFAAKLELVKKYNLRGISVFDLGSEDPRIWHILAAST